MPVLNDQSAQVRDHVLIEEDTPSYGLYENELPDRSRTIVTSDSRLTRYSTGESELYDLVEDRGERRNLFDQSASADLRHDMTERLVDSLVGAAEHARLEGAPRET